MLKFDNPLDTDVDRGNVPIGTAVGGNLLYGGPKYGDVTQEEYDELLKSGKLGRGQQTVELYGEHLLKHASKIYNKVGEYIPDLPGPNERVKKGLNITKNVAGFAYDWTIKSGVETGMELLGLPVEAAHWGSKKIDPTGRGIGRAPLGIAETILTAGGPTALKGGKALVNKGDDIARLLSRTDNLALATNGVLSQGVEVGLKNDNLIKTSFQYSNVSVPKKVTKTKFLSEPLYDVNTTKVNRTAGGYQGLGHQGLANIMYKDNPGLKLKFGKLRSYQQQSPFKHHHIEDIAFTGQWANTSDFEEVFKELNKIKIYPGDSPTNIIGMMDEGNLFLQTGKTDLLRELKRTNFPGLENIERYSDLMRKDAPKGVKRLIDDVFKSPEYGDEFFKGSIDKLGRKTPNQMQNMFETLPDGTRVPTVLPQKDIGFDTWKALGLDTVSENFRKLPIEQQQLLKSQTWSNRFKILGVNRKNIKYDPTKMILSKDHIDTIHYKVYDSPKFTQKRELLKMIEDGSYHKLTAKQKAEKIAEVYKVQKNTSINVAKVRLKLIKKYIKENVAHAQADLLLRDPTKLRQWIIDNPGISANLGWKKGIPDYKTLTNPKTAEIITDEFRTVFSTLVR